MLIPNGDTNTAIGLPSHREAKKPKMADDCRKTFPSEHSRAVDELTAVMAAWTKPVSAKDTPSTSKEKEAGHTGPLQLQALKLMAQPLSLILYFKMGHESTQNPQMMKSK